MDIWKYFDVTHRKHVVCNPSSEAKLTKLVELLKLPRGARVVDIACGKAEFLIRMTERYDVNGVGVDISPFFIAQAKENCLARVPNAKLTLLEINGADYKPDEPASLQAASCLGASWIWQGHEGTLKALIDMVEPGGWVITGEPYWLIDPPAEYLASMEASKEDFGTHRSNVEVAEKLGLQLAYTIVSSPDDWDEYEGLQWYAANEYARENPDDPDLSEIQAGVEKSRMEYIRWGRETFNWAIYLFRKGGTA